MLVFCLSFLLLPSLLAQQLSGTFPYELVGGKILAALSSRLQGSCGIALKRANPITSLIFFEDV